MEESRPKRASTMRGATVPFWTLLVPVVAAIALVLVMSQRSDGRLHLWVFDVGEGDAMLLLTPKGHSILIDGGPGATALVEDMGKHLPFWQHSIDIAILTSPKQENLMGLVDVLGRYKIGQIVQTEFTATDSVQQAWLDSLKKSGTPVQSAKRGDLIGFQDEPDVALRVLNPGDGDILKGDQSTLEDDHSIVLRVEYGQTNILLAGDVESGAEINMEMQASDLLRSQVLKVAEHGSNNTSTQGFIDAVKPAVSIISVAADNKPGYPSPVVLDRLHNAGSQIYRTDQDGTTEITAEKDRFWVSSEK